MGRIAGEPGGLRGTATSSGRTGRAMKYDHTNVLADVCCKERGVNTETLEQVIVLAVEIAREGREGRKVGTMFVVADTPEVLKNSHALILDPLYGHPDHLKRVDNPDARETLKELAQLDGAFVISDDGVAVSACRYIDASSKGITIPLGLGSRHVAAASITRTTDAVAVVVSESSVVRVFDDGELIAEIIPELWLLARYSHHLTGTIKEHKDEHITVLAKDSKASE